VTTFADHHSVFSPDDGLIIAIDHKPSRKNKIKDKLDAKTLNDRKRR
jgi:hypothetical protein